MRQLSLRVQELAVLELHYQKIAPASLLRSSHIMHIQGQTLTIAADNGAVAAKLRQISEELISSFTTRGCEVTGIQIRVQVQVPTLQAKQVHRIVGEKGKQELESLTQNMADSPLKAALQRLARR
ncbi:MAG: DciA family protein [Sideroxydans sp.]|nr:DciA family protein [Sideroxydans sp.]